MDALIGFLERLLPFQFRSARVGSFFDISEDNYKFLLYELFLYVLAAFIKARRYAGVATLLDHQYVAPELFGMGGFQSFTYGEFNEYVKSLDELYNSQQAKNRLSVTADQIAERATRKDITLADIVQADVLCMLASMKRRSYWNPRLIIYGSCVGKLELFARAVNERGFAAVKTILSIKDAAELFSIVSSDKMRQLRGLPALQFARMRLDDLLNLREIAHAYGIATKEE